MRAASPRRSESPQYQNQQHQQRTGVRNSNSGDRQVPVQHENNFKRSSTPQRQTQTPPRQTQPVPNSHQQQQQQHQFYPQQQNFQPATDQNQSAGPAQSAEQKATAAKQKALEDSITKIQKIQQSVLNLMGRVEQYDGKDKKEYLFLDEMLTQNLLKLDDIDAEGKDNIKSARREAIKCINSLISLLEAKKDGASQNESANEASNEINEPQNGTSKNSSYDNMSKVQQNASNNSVNMTEVPVSEKTAEANLEEKIANALSKQDEKSKH
jgi:hypothetical protein